MKEENNMEKEPFYTSLLQNSRDTIIRTDTKLKMLEISPAFKILTGYDPKRFLGKYAWKVPLLTRDSIKPILKTSYQMIRRKTPEDYQISFKRKDGSLAFAEVSPSPIINGKKVVGFHAVIEDITEKITTERELSEKEKKLEMIFNNISDFIFLQEFGDPRKARIIEVNDTAYKSLGYKESSLKGKTPEDIGMKLLSTKESIRKQLKRSGIVNYDITLETKRGKIIPMNTTSHVFKIAGQKVILSVCRDVSVIEKYKKELEKKNEDLESFSKELEDKVKERTSELEDANKNIVKLLDSKTEFLNRVAHDLRTPLTPISILTDILMKKRILMMMPERRFQR